MTSPHTQRKHMILGQLYTNAIHDPRLLQALSSVPREAFVTARWQGASYVDDDIEITPDRALMAPLTFARLVALAELTPRSRVLVVGCTTGYPLAIVAQLAGQVVGVDIDAEMVTHARSQLDAMGFKQVQVHKIASLADGYPKGEPYDAIIVPGAIDYVPDALAAQLSDGGRLVAIHRTLTPPALKGAYGKGLVVKRIDTRLQHREAFEAAAPLLPGFDQGSRFRF